MEVIAVAGYGALCEVYEWLIGDDKLTPAEAAAVYYNDAVGSLPSNARVLDCACGTGQLAVGLASLGLDVVAADASDGMVRRTEKLASEHGDALRALRASWDELPDHLEDSTFDLVFCVGNSLGHAGGAAARLTPVEAMSATESGRPPRAHLTQLGARALRRLTGRRPRSTRPPQRPRCGHQLLLADRAALGAGALPRDRGRPLTVQTTTFDPGSDGYLVVASRDQARGTPKPAR